MRKSIMLLSDKNTAKPIHFTLNCNGRLIDLSEAKIMGILNLTPDSFYKGSRFTTNEVVKQTEKLLKQGATFIDIGGMSSRPGAEIIDSNTELNRILPAIKDIKKNISEALISIDTIHAETAKQCLDIGVDCINDITAGKYDDKMLETVAAYKVPFIAMHTKGTPQTMKSLAQYDDLVLEMMDYFIERITACNMAGIVDIVLDPGFGFAKTISHNFELLGKMKEFAILDLPILAGISRKSLIWKTLDITADEALNGTTALHMICLQNGANLLRVHDVKEAQQCITLYNQMQ